MEVDDTTTPVRAIAKFIVQKSKTPVSNLKLQKLLYYVQGWHLGIYGKPVFTEDIQAWIHGPVVPEVFQTYREFKWTPISVDTNPVAVDKHTENHVLKVLASFGNLTATQLEALSHEESPWIEARRGLEQKEPSQVVITHDSMKRFFGKKANG